MDRYDYKVIIPPEKGLKVKGIKDAGARFAHALETAMNELGRDGWEYWRSECLPSVERSGLTGSKTTERHLLVFRRLRVETPPAAQPILAVPEPQPAAVPEPEPEPQPLETPRENAPVFTRRLEIAREQRQAVTEGQTPPVQNRPLTED